MKAPVRWKVCKGVGLVAGFVLETLPGAAPRVAERLARLPGISVVGGDGDLRLAAVWICRNGGSMDELADRLLEADPEVLGIYPAYVSRVTASGESLSPWP